MYVGLTLDGWSVIAWDNGYVIAHECGERINGTEPIDRMLEHVC